MFYSWNKLKKDKGLEIDLSSMDYYGIPINAYTKLEDIILSAEVALRFLIAYGPPKPVSFEDALSSIATAALHLRASLLLPTEQILSSISSKNPFMHLFHNDLAAKQMAKYASGTELSEINEQNEKFLVLIAEQIRLKNNQEDYAFSAIARTMPFEFALKLVPSMIFAYPKTTNLAGRMATARTAERVDAIAIGFRNAYEQEWHARGRKRTLNHFRA